MTNYQKNQKALTKLRRAAEHILNTDSVAPGVYCLCSIETSLALTIIWRQMERLSSYSF